MQPLSNFINQAFSRSAKVSAHESITVAPATKRYHFSYGK